MNLDFTLQNILAQYIPLTFGLLGIVVFLVGIIKMIGGNENAFSNIFSGLFIVAVAVGLRILMQSFLLEALGL